MNETTVDLAKLPAKLVDRAIEISGASDPQKLVRWALERGVAEAETPISKLPKELQQSEREARAGKGKTFASGRAAVKWLKGQ